MTQTTLAPNGALTPRLREIADKVTALTKMSHDSGFSTRRTVRELLSPLTTDELIAVAMYNQQQQPDTTRDSTTR